MRLCARSVSGLLPIDPLKPSSKRGVSTPPEDRDRRSSRAAICETLERRTLLAAQIIEVANGLDEDGGGNPVAGSLRAAIVTANENPGSTIAFDQLPAGTAITLGDDLPPITAANTTVDGTTGPGGRTKIEGMNHDVFQVGATDFSVKGMWIYDYQAAIDLAAGSSSAVVTNNYIGTLSETGPIASGASNAGSAAVVIENGSSDNTIGGTDPADRNVIGGQIQNGVFITDTSGSGNSSNNVVEGNYFGVDPTGEIATGLSGSGVVLYLGATNNLIQNNLISGSDTGVLSESTGNTVTHNVIGLDAAGTTAIPNVFGVSLDGGSITSGVIVPGDTLSDNTIADNTGRLTGNDDTFTGAGVIINGSNNLVKLNTISGNGLEGIYVASGAQDNTISQNSISLNDSANNGLGIDLGNDDRVLANSITGGTQNNFANGDQPYPVLTVTDAGDGTNLTVGISLQSNIDTQYTVELFANAPGVVSSSGFGQGQTYITSVTVTTGLSGIATGTVNISKALYNNDYITATATNSSAYSQSTNPDGGATSEFSQNVAGPGVNTVVVPAASVTTLGLSATTISAGAPLTLTTSVSPLTPGGPIPTGTVTFIAIEGVFAPSQTVALGADGTATLQLPTVQLQNIAGVYSLTANYSGDANYLASVSTATTLTVTSMGTGTGTAPSVTNLSATAHTLVVGQGESLILSVTSASSSGPTPTGTVSIFEDGNFKGTYDLAGNGQAVLSWFALTPAPIGTNYTAFYSGDSNYAASTSNVLTQVYLPASTSVPIFSNAAFPGSAIAGGAFKAKVPIVLTNSGVTLSGVFVVNLYIDAAAFGLDGNQVLLSSISKKLTLKSGKGQTLPFSLKSLSASIANGTYHLVAEIVDPTGNINTVASAQTIVVAAPNIALAASASSVSPASLSVGKSGSISVTVTNNGNIDANGSVNLTVSPSSDGLSPVGGISLGSLSSKADIKVGKSKTFKVHFKLPGTIAAGTYHPYVAVSLAGAMTSVVGSGTFTVT